MTRPKLLLFAAVVAVALGVVAAFFMLRTTPLDEAVAAIEQRDYFFEEDPDADPGLSPASATSRISDQQPSLGPVAGFLTHDSPGRVNRLKDQAVYLFVVDELHEPGPVILDGPPPTSRHVVFIYEEGGALSTTAIPLED